MDSLGNECNELKRQYDACFNTWFSEHFLKGQKDESMCAPIFKVYQECVKRAIRDHKIEIRELEGDYTTGDYDTKSEHSKS